MTVAVLTSGMSLGHYVPGLLIRSSLRALGHQATTYVFEEYLQPPKQQAIDQTKRAYHANVALARVGQRLARRLRPELETAAADRVIDEWRRRDIRRFIVISGYWTCAVQRYREAAGAVDIELCHIDSAESPSWTDVDDRGMRHRWLWSHADGCVHHYLNVPVPVIPYDARPEAILAHGGGWGLGEYDTMTSLRGRFGVSLVAYAPEDVKDEPGVRYYVSDPDWRPWSRDAAGEHQFPPLLNETFEEELPRRAHPLLRAVGNSLAVFSKPGGATLVDSLATATPIVFLTAYGAHERCNAELWQRLGFGISLEDWQRSGCSTRVLRDLHLTMLSARARIPDYPSSYVSRGEGDIQ